MTTTNAATQTFAGAGIAVGFAAATAVAEGMTAAPPYADVTTDGLDGAVADSRVAPVVCLLCLVSA